MTVGPLPGGRAEDRAEDRAEVRSEIPGTVLRLEVAPGDAVAAGDVVALLESMKMEIPVLAERPGTVGEVLVGPGDAVPADRAIVRLVPSGAAQRRAS